MHPAELAPFEIQRLCFPKGLELRQINHTIDFGRKVKPDRKKGPA
jgi:hypothetical protein